MKLSGLADESRACLLALGDLQQHLGERQNKSQDGLALSWFKKLEAPEKDAIMAISDQCFIRLVLQMVRKQQQLKSNGVHFLVFPELIAKPRKAKSGPTFGQEEPFITRKVTHYHEDDVENAIGRAAQRSAEACLQSHMLVCCSDVEQMLLIVDPQLIRNCERLQEVLTQLSGGRFMHTTPAVKETEALFGESEWFGKQGYYTLAQLLANKLELNIWRAYRLKTQHSHCSKRRKDLVHTRSGLHSAFLEQLNGVHLFLGKLDCDGRAQCLTRCLAQALAAAVRLSHSQACASTRSLLPSDIQRLKMCVDILSVMSASSAKATFESSPSARLLYLVSDPLMATTTVSQTLRRALVCSLADSKSQWYQKELLEASRVLYPESIEGCRRPPPTSGAGRRRRKNLEKHRLSGSRATSSEGITKQTTKVPGDKFETSSSGCSPPLKSSAVNSTQAEPRLNILHLDACRDEWHEDRNGPAQESPGAEKDDQAQTLAPQPLPSEEVEPSTMRQPAACGQVNECRLMRDSRASSAAEHMSKKGLLGSEEKGCQTSFGADASCEAPEQRPAASVDPRRHVGTQTDAGKKSIEYSSTLDREPASSVACGHDARHSDSALQHLGRPLTDLALLLSAEVAALRSILAVGRGDPPALPVLGAGLMHPYGHPFAMQRMPTSATAPSNPLQFRNLNGRASKNVEICSEDGRAAPSVGLQHAMLRPAGLFDANVRHRHSFDIPVSPAEADLSDVSTDCRITGERTSREHEDDELTKVNGDNSPKCMTHQPESTGGFLTTKGLVQATNSVAASDFECPGFQLCGRNQRVKSRLSIDLADFMVTISDISEARVSAERAAVQRCRSIVQSIWPRSHVEPYGSFLTRLSLPSSDIDLVIRLPQVRTNVPAEAPGALEGFSIKQSWQQELARRLRSDPWVNQTSLQVIAHTAIPVLRFQLVNLFRKNSVTARPESPIFVDISFEGPEHNGLCASRVILGLLRELKALRPLALVLKHFLRERGLLESYSGGLSSYGLVLMLARYLQEQSADLDAGSLLLGFLDLTANHFDPRTTGISVSRRTYFARQQQSCNVLMSRSGAHPSVASPLSASMCATGQMCAQLPFRAGRYNTHDQQQALLDDPYAPLYVEDPVTPGRNVGRNCFRIYQIQRVLGEAYQRLLHAITAGNEAQSKWPLLGTVLLTHPSGVPSDNSVAAS